jgi:hypothetical protein
MIIGRLRWNGAFMNRMDDKLQHGIRRQSIDLVQLAANQIGASVSYHASVVCRGEPAQACGVVFVILPVGSLDPQVQTVLRHSKSDVFWRQKLGLDSALGRALWCIGVLSMSFIRTTGRSLGAAAAAGFCPLTGHFEWLVEDVGRGVAGVVLNSGEVKRCKSSCVDSRFLENLKKMLSWGEKTEPYKRSPSRGVAIVSRERPVER